MELPIELEWHIIKFMQHPVANMIENESFECVYDIDDHENNFCISYFRRIALNRQLKDMDKAHIRDKPYFEMLINHYFRLYAC